MVIQSILLAISLSFGSAGQTSGNENLLLGSPSVEKPGYTLLLVKKGFVVMHDNVRKGPLWVTFLMRKEYVANNPREGSFAADDALPVGQRAELDDYYKSGFDRGHMAASADMRRADNIQADSFLLSNIWPQNHTLNAGAWAQLEALMRGYAVKSGAVQIYVGPVFTRPLPANAPPIPKTIGIGKVAVPTGFYRIIVRKKADGHYEALAFEMPNAPVSKKADLAIYLVSVRQVELDTSLDFCNNLSKVEQDSFETTRPRKLW